MSVFQPLYFAGGRYTAGTDRKLLAAVFGADSSGERLVGVIPSNIGTDSLKVSTTTGLGIRISTGMCVIADSSSQSGTSPGLYLAGVDTNFEIMTLAQGESTTKYDVIYAQVDETPKFITNKALDHTTSIATLTSAAHGFSVNETVVVSGIDDIFDGTYTITAKTTDTFSYAKSHATSISSSLVVATATGYPNSGSATVTAVINNKKLTSNIAELTTASAHGLVSGETITVKGVDAVFDGVHQLIEGTTGSTLKYSINKVADDVSNTSVSTLGGTSIAVARVPFSIRKVRNSSAGAGYPSGITAIELAEITVANGATSITSGNISDKRQFVTTSGGLHIYNSDSGSADPGSTNPFDGMMRYDVATNTLQVYDSTATPAAGFQTLYASNKTGEVFPRLGGSGSATTASRSDHVHAVGTLTGSYGYDGVRTSAATDASIPANTTTLDATWSGFAAKGVAFAAPTSGRVMVMLSGLLQTKNTGKLTIVSVRIGTGTTLAGGTSVISQAVDSYNTIRVEGYNDNDTYVRLNTTFVVSGLTPNLSAYNYNATFYFYNSDSTSVGVSNAVIQVVSIP